MQPAYGDVSTAIYPIVHRLSGYAQTASQLCITHVFFIITRRRFSCDSYFSFFIFDWIINAYIISLTTRIGSEAKDLGKKPRDYQHVFTHQYGYWVLPGILVCISKILFLIRYSYFMRRAFSEAVNHC